MECCCYLRNIQDKLSNGKTPYDRRFGIPLNGPALPLGGMVEYPPISAKDLSRLHQFDSKVLPGIFLCCAGGIWKGDFMVADIEELEEMDASELHARRLDAKEVSTPQRSGNFIFPPQNSQNLWKRTASENIHLNPGPTGTRRRIRNSSRKYSTPFVHDIGRTLGAQKTPPQDEVHLAPCVRFAHRQLISYRSSRVSFTLAGGRIC